MLSPHATSCGKVVAASKILASDGLTLASIETTSHRMEVWVGRETAVPKPGSEVLVSPRGNVVFIDAAGGKSLGSVATRAPIRPRTLSLACRWLAAHLLSFGARALEDMHIAPLARQLDRSSQAVGCEALPGVRAKDVAVAD